MFIYGSAQSNSCPLGTYLDRQNDVLVCAECPDGTFMPQKDHTNTECFDCTKIEEPTLEILIFPCTKTRDTDIQCVEGYYRVLPRNPRSKAVCQECTPCHHLLHEIRRCQNYSDTWCCSDVNYDYEYDKDGIAMCRERPWICRKGQYVDTLVNDCRPCSEGTFMSVDYHSYTECWNCLYKSEADLPLHTEITQPCNCTHPTIYSCKEGYYVNHSLSYRGDDIGCMQCKSCSDGMFVGRQCDKSHDTICCDRPDIIIIDGADGMKCIDSKNQSANDPPNLKCSVENITICVNDSIDQTTSNDKCKNQLHKDSEKDSDIALKIAIPVVAVVGIGAGMLIAFAYVKFTSRRGERISQTDNELSESL